MVLVDGSRLADLMIDHGMGVSARMVRVPSVDRDDFAEDQGSRSRGSAAPESAHGPDFDARRQEH